MSPQNGKCRRGSGAKPKPNSPLCSTEGSSPHDGQPGPAHEISDSPAPFQPLREQARALAVVPDNLQQIAAAAAKAEQVATQRILPQHLLNPQRQAGGPLSANPRPR